MEPGSHFKQAPHAALDRRRARRRPRDAREQFQQRSLASPVSTHQPDNFALLDLEVHVLQCPQIIDTGALTAAERALQRAHDHVAEHHIPLALSHAVTFAQAFYSNYSFTHYFGLPTPRLRWCFPFFENKRAR